MRAVLSDSLTLALKVKPNCRHPQPLRLLQSEHGERLYELGVNAPPVDGKANSAVIARLADLLDLPKSALTLTHGTSGRLKRVKIEAEPVQIARITRFLNTVES